VEKTHSHAAAAARPTGGDGMPSRRPRALRLLLLLAALLLPALLAAAPAAAQTATPPQIVAMSPTGVGVDPNAKVVLTFDRALDPASITVYGEIGMSSLTDYPIGYRVEGGVAYDAASRTVTFTPGVRPYWDAPFAYGLPPGVSMRVYAGARDAAGNVLPVAQRLTYWTRACPCSVWADSAVPTTPSVAPSGPVELGVKFSAAADGYVTGVRFYKGAHNTGTHVGHLWHSNGTLLASATFTDESATGWQEVRFAAPVAVQALQHYVVSYYAPDGGYAYDPAFFGAGRPAPPVVSGPLDASSDSGAQGPGVYRYGGSGFPTNSYNRTNYWVDPIFTTAP
jgi:hypothetical protein